MSRKDKLAAILTALLLGAVPGFARELEDPSVQRYDLERGPVFYEAYYPDNNESPTRNYAGKQFYDREAILERSYQVPVNLQENPYDSLTNEREVQYQDDFPEPAFSQIGSFGVAWNNDYDDNNLLREPPSFSRKTIPEKWNLVSNDPQGSRYSRANSDLQSHIPLGKRPITERDLQMILPNSIYKKSYEKPFLQGAEILPVPVEIATVNLISKMAPRVAETPKLLVYQNFVRKLPERIVYDNPVNLMSEPESTLENFKQIEGSNFEPVYPILYKRQYIPEKSLSEESVPSENIFEPRPQVINYIFSKDTVKSENTKDKDKVETMITTTARSYGDNLIQEDIKKMNNEKQEEVKVTSIEVSEVPKHKIRHHHGERHRRDYPHQSSN